MKSMASKLPTSYTVFLDKLRREKRKKRNERIFNGLCLVVAIASLGVCAVIMLTFGAVR